MIAIPLSFFEGTAHLRVVHADLFFDETGFKKIFILEYIIY